jgi:hypothetical protein
VSFVSKIPASFELRVVGHVSVQAGETLHNKSIQSPINESSCLPRLRTLRNKKCSQQTMAHQPRPGTVAWSGNNVVDLASGRAVGMPGPAQRYRVTRPREHASRVEPQPIQLLGGRISVTLETMFYVYLGLLLLGVLYKRGWFTSGGCEDDFQID